MKIKTLPAFILLLISFNAFSQTIDDYYTVIKEQGKEPVRFIADKLNSHDLIIFDDAMHLAVEPFDFVCDYLTKNPESIDYLFLEVFHITAQKNIDAFLNGGKKDTALLAEVFQRSRNFYV